jgi:hypothetical protein
MTALAGVAGALMLGAGASAEVLYWDFDISEDQVKNGPEADGSTNSPGTGHGAITYDTATNVLSYTISWSNLFGALTKLHIHGPADANSSNPQHVVEIFGPPDIPMGVDLHTDTWSDSIVLTTLSQPGFDDLSPTQIIGIMESGLSYVNVHTSVFGAGEIRGNLGLPTPTPGAATLFAIPGVALLRRRR